MTTDDLYLLVAETRCEHGLLSLDAALRSGDDWTAFLRAPTHPDPFAVRDFPAYQALAPHLPAAWIVPPPRPAPPRRPPRCPHPPRPGPHPRRRPGP